MRFGKLLVALVGLASVAMAGTGVGKYAGEFLALGVGGRALGLGGAYVALANDVTAGYWNPAALARITYPQVTLMHEERFGSLVNYDYGAVAFPLGRKASLGVSLVRLGVDEIPDTRNAGVDINGNLTYDPTQFSRVDPNRVTYFNAADWALYVSYARGYSGDFSYGANLKLIRREMGENSATGIGVDVGVWYRPLQNLLLGANVQDITTTFLAWNTGTNELISPTLKVGSAYLIDALGGRFSPAMDVDVRFENRRSASMAHLGAVSFDMHAGVEYEFREIVALRVGYSDIKQLTLGAGVHLPKLNIDYSFMKFDGTEDLGSMHRISMTFTLESDQYAREAE